MNFFCLLQITPRKSMFVCTSRIAFIPAFTLSKCSYFWGKCQLDRPHTPHTPVSQRWAMQTSEFPGLTTMTSKRHRYDHIWITTSSGVSKYGARMPNCVWVTWLIYIEWGTICIGRGTVTSVEGKKSGYGLRRWVAGLEFIKVYGLVTSLFWF